ncbi:hypothetical protein F7734_07450 [Scytonema sp. UIC 10036]|uniref:hypothetical protein n=1 Tax=Scytonema sp. UIC 10036 TaxID=2304196 RepID=UPI0012DA36D5|nr:hypothetical protein [Scytonema sp. UIC 10036]MUG92296.1 hypothetical protein [Scytonema sp. UIC 10036]MUG92298.1 hypothetical protein [Scytonema sp. UIC 10036]MUG92299.1 hypothetical protein [Scytonema sp. UIC 10036]
MFSQRLAATLEPEQLQQSKQKKLSLIAKIHRSTLRWFDSSTTSSRSMPKPPRTGGTDTKGAGDRR